MAYTVTNVIDEYGVATTTFTSATAYTFAASDRVEFAVLWTAADSGENPTGVTDTKSNTWTSVAAPILNYASSGFNYQIWECKQITSAGSTNITVTFAGSAGHAGMAGVGATGLSNTASAVSAQQGQTNPGTGTGAVTSGTMTPGAQPAMMMGLAQSISGNFATGVTVATGTSHALTHFILANGGAGAAALSDQRLTSLTAVGPTFTDSNGAGDTLVSLGVVVPEAGGGGGGGVAVSYYLGSSNFF